MSTTVIYNWIITDEDRQETRASARGKPTGALLERHAPTRDHQGESKTADPRKLILDTAQTSQQAVGDTWRRSLEWSEVTNVDVNVSVNTKCLQAISCR